jgi:hypothetical protein
MNLRQPTLAANAGFACLDDDTGNALLDPLGDVTGQRVLILGRDIGVMCGLIRRGCRSVIELEQNGRPAIQAADLAIVPSALSADAAASAIALARRGLTPSGRIAVRTRTDALSRAVKRTLKLQGFTGISARGQLADMVVFAHLRALPEDGQ